MVFKKKSKEETEAYIEQKKELDKSTNVKVINLGKEATTELPGKELTPTDLVLNMTDNEYRTEVLVLLSEIVHRLQMTEGEKELKKDK